MHCQLLIICFIFLIDIIITIFILLTVKLEVPILFTQCKTEHLKLLENDVKIIILDHHEIENDFDYGKYNDNIAIVSSQLNYPNPALRGAGVALKFAQAYGQIYGKPLPKKLYALAACGIVADVMDISNLCPNFTQMYCDTIQVKLSLFMRNWI